MARIRFSSVIIAKDLIRHDFLKFKQNEIGLPNFIYSLVNKAKKNSTLQKMKWSQTNSGKIAFSFILGFYDGDGTYLGGRQAKIYNSNKKFLDELKKLFEIENIVRKQTVYNDIEEDNINYQKGVYYLTLSPNIFDLMISSFLHSMSRKRPTSDDISDHLIRKK